MTEVVHIADIKRRVLATQAKLSAASQSGPTINARLVALLESVEKTLLHNQAQIRKLRRGGLAVAAVALLGWLAAAGLAVDRYYGGGDSDLLDVVLAGESSGDTTTLPALGGRGARGAAADTETAPQASEPGTATQTAAVPDGETSGADDVILRPQAYDGQEVTVTGAMVRLFSRYRLRSADGQDTLAIDLGGLAPAERAGLEAALEEIGALGSLRVRIVGSIEREEAESYFLRVAELVVLD